MTKKSVRTVRVDGVEFTWVLRGNTIDGFHETHIDVFREQNGQRLKLDPYGWHFEVRPQTVVTAIRFALDSGWTPGQPRPPIYVGCAEKGFFVLPEGVFFSHELPDAVRLELEQAACIETRGRGARGRRSHD